MAEPRTTPELTASCRALLDAHADALVIVDAAGAIVASNRAFGESIARGLAQPCASIDELVPADAAMDHPLRSSMLWQALEAHDARAGQRGVVLVRSVDGLWPVEVSIGAAVIDGSRLALVALHDARARLEVERRLHYASTHDTLTALSNRAALEEMRGSIEQRRAPFAVVIADVDGLKAVNDKHGHEEGDVLIVEAADAMRCAVASGEDIVARLGGDEFALVLIDADEARLDDAIASVRSWVAQRALRRDAHPALALSVGGALRAGSETLARVMRRADEEMYRDKTARRGATSASRS